MGVEQIVMKFAQYSQSICSFDQGFLLKLDAAHAGSKGICYALSSCFILGCLSGKISEDSFKIISDYNKLDTLVAIQKAYSDFNEDRAGISEVTMAAKTPAQWKTLFENVPFHRENYYTGPLGPDYTPGGTCLRLWAPTAEAVTVALYHRGSGGAVLGTKPLVRGAQGVWSIWLPGEQHGRYYTFAVTVNGITRETGDPYARAAGVFLLISIVAKGVFRAVMLKYCYLNLSVLALPNLILCNISFIIDCVKLQRSSSFVGVSHKND